MNLTELKRLYDQPLFDLISQSRAKHLAHWRGEQVQRCSLLSIKTGGCSEDCAYCAQSGQAIRHRDLDRHDHGALILTSASCAAGALLIADKQTLRLAPSRLHPPRSDDCAHDHRYSGHPANPRPLARARAKGAVHGQPAQPLSGDGSYIQRNGSWPQIFLKNFASDEDYANAWVAALDPFGIPRKTWICPTIQELLHDPPYNDPANARLDYVSTGFDDKPTSPHQWPRQPWFIETGDVHGNGNLIIFTDGSIDETKNVLPK